MLLYDKDSDSVEEYSTKKITYYTKQMQTSSLVTKHSCHKML